MKPGNHPLSDQLVDEICDTAVRAAKAAGDIQSTHFGTRNKFHLAGHHDVKLEVDQLCDAAILKTISERFPQHAIVTEENGKQQNKSEFVWIVDPLDGTVNFWRGIPYFGSSVACYYIGGTENYNRTASPSGRWAIGSPIAGVVYTPLMDELFIGITGRGATCNSLPIAANDERNLGDAVISLSFGSNEPAMQRMQHLCNQLVRRVRKVRILGSTALDMVNIANGRLSALLQSDVRIWDFAAARVVLEAGGGILEAKETSANHWEILASAPGLHSSLKALTREYGSTEENDQSIGLS
jgi:fructose-1,6-bisphosphatase/inositol monophosphatase family enzyme